MTRSNINETAVYIQVRTVVWEDGAVRPLLPDSPAEARRPGGVEAQPETQRARIGARLPV
jgi:hypothetical protein